MRQGGARDPRRLKAMAENRGGSRLQLIVNMLRYTPGSGYPRAWVRQQLGASALAEVRRAVVAAQRGEILQSTAPELLRTASLIVNAEHRRRAAEKRYAKQLEREAAEWGKLPGGQSASHIGRVVRD